MATRKRKTGRQITAENEAEQLEKWVWKSLLKMDALQEEIDKLEEARIIPKKN